MSDEKHSADEAADRLAEAHANGQAGDPRDLAAVLADLRDRVPVRKTLK